MHDAVSGEALGIPSVGIMTEQFVSAAELMRQVLGAGAHPFVTIAHPISSATPDALVEEAKRAAAECVEIMTGDSWA